jgi:YfiH family protein
MNLIAGPRGGPWDEVRVVQTMRRGGVSAAPFADFNLAAHVGDDPASVAENRRRLRAAYDLPAEPLWLEQAHGRAVAIHDGRHAAGEVPRADAAVTFAPGRVCVVMAADCLPVVFVDGQGSRVGVAHAGWRGLAGGVLEATVAALAVEPVRLHAWLGPAIGPQAFEVGDEVRAAFLDQDAAAAEAFRPNERGRWWADIYALARRRLAALGVASISGGGLCTHGDARQFFSYRRDGRTGRMATLAWLPQVRGRA